MKRIILAKQRKYKKYVVKADRTMTPEEEADFDRRWEEKFGYMKDGYTFRGDEFEKFMEEVMKFE